MSSILHKIAFLKPREASRRPLSRDTRGYMHYGVDKIHRGMLGAEGCGQIRESQSTQSLELRFRALLTESGVERVEWARV